MLLFLPCLFGIFLALKNSDNFSGHKLFGLLFLFGLGSVLMRSAGCVINDIFDRKFDAQVARTKRRPLPSGRVSTLEAVTFLMFLLILGALILLQFNFYVQLSGLVALALVALYPLMKRITFYPQIFLGITFNYGILMADLAINEKVAESTVALFAACVIWTLIYDTIYAFQDIDDDLKIGVKSSAIKFAKSPRTILASLALSMLALFFYVGFLQEFSWRFYAIILAAFFYECFLVLSCNYSDSSYCLRAFKANILVGFLMLVAIICG